MEVSLEGRDHEDQQEDHFQADLFVDRSYTEQEMNMNGVKVRIEALHSAASTDFDLTGQIVWPASQLLSLYLTTRGLKHPANPRILEVGSGVGLAGLVAAKILTSREAEVPSSKPEVVLTDNEEEVLKVLRRNIDLNFPDGQTGKPECVNLSWGENVKEFSRDHGTFDIILGADVVFWPSAVPLLFNTAAELLNPGENSRVIISYVSRSNFSTELMFTCASKSGFTWEEVDLSSDEVFSQLIQDQRDCGRKANLLIFTRKSPTL